MYSKELLKGTINAMILRLLSEQERMYGYEIFLHVKDLTEGKILLKDGSLYPALQKLSADGLLSYKEEEVNGRTRKYYYITKKGRKEGKVYMEELQDFVETISRVVLPKLKLI